MNVTLVTKILKKHRYCPDCNRELMSDRLELKDEVLTIGCECGFEKRFDANGKEIKTV